MCKGESQSASCPPSWLIERSGAVWRCKVTVSDPPELEINSSALRLKLDQSEEPFTLPIPEHALPLDPDSARCTFSKRRHELVIEWPYVSADGSADEEKGIEEDTSQVDNTASPADVVQATPEVASMSPLSEESEVAARSEKEISQEPIGTSLQSNDKSHSEEVSLMASTEENEDASVSAEEWKARGNAAVKSGELENAIVCYSSGISKVGSDGEAAALLHSNRALCFFKLNRLQEAADDADRCVALKPDFVKGYLRGAMALRALERPAEALALLKRAPVNDEACSLAAEIRPEAEAAEKARIEALPKAERAKEEGNTLFRKGLFEAATEKYSEALKLCEEPTGSLALSVRNNRAACYHQVSDFSAVIKDTDFVLEHEPCNFKALVRRMLALEPLERYDQALKDARAVLLQDPRNEMANKVQHRLGKLVRDLSREKTGA